MDTAVYDLPEVVELIDRALAEDLGATGDLTCACLVPDDARLRGTITAKGAGVVCGLPLFARVFARAGGGVEVTQAAADGTPVAPGDAVLRCRGRAATILQGERTALNLVQRLSGTATLARHCAGLVVGTGATVYDTRKTTPGLRRLQKHAVVAGGARNHRQGLHDQVLIKENHIALMGPGGPAAAVRRCRERLGPAAVIEVEIERLADLEPVIAAGADIVLLDNLGPGDLREAVRLRAGRPVALEASGGITADNLRAVAETGVDRISLGALTHSALPLDLSLRCEPWR
jgi:nicotinate-nucleotide pyrophosphorylase (carboxylating)